MDDLPRIRTVVVDDDRIVRALVRVHLEVHGCFRVVGEAADGGEGLREVQRRRPDLVVLDLNMPGLDGFWALPRILDVEPDALVVVHSAMDGPDAPLRCRALGAEAFLAKRASLADLPERILEALRGSPRAVRLLRSLPPTGTLPTVTPRAGREEDGR